MNDFKKNNSVANSTIMIVEDHNALRRSLREWLAGIFPACSFIEAVSGEEAITVARAGSPDIIIMDIGLQGMNGIETTRRIKTVTPAAKIVILSIYEDNIRRADAAAAGANAYVAKRVMHTELLPVLAQLLGVY